ncbi:MULTISPECIES: hypothetical protein [Mycobacterium avium complex (MAC)]|uniref:hypothetical protein n=1 Tax=Mycobacterium avium complex (MAC) TaxID=120793 RepID=UPI00191C7C77|nr:MULTISPECIES: hypothetical protein [Mycobacterium avium complex (MAC)]UCN12922.1 hypothetical protein LFT50_28935 [Mycobacterium intracellulare subsp. chimaera]
MTDIEIISPAHREQGIRMTEHDDIPELTEAQRLRWKAASSDMREMSAGLRDGTATHEEMQGALNRLLSCDIDRSTLLNSLHIPDDAGIYAAGLEQILRRIPDGWGRWISHDAGWYPIVTRCDEQLAAIDPDYIVHQVKEKFGTLRYYCGPSSDMHSTHLREQFSVIVREAEAASARTCERCSAAGSLRDRRHWLKTLCDACAEALDYP